MSFIELGFCPAPPARHIKGRCDGRQDGLGDQAIETSFRDGPVGPGRINLSGFAADWASN
jgi:hypothetical protein